MRANGALTLKMIPFGMILLLTIIFLSMIANGIIPLNTTAHMTPPITTNPLAILVGSPRIPVVGITTRLMKITGRRKNTIRRSMARRNHPCSE